MPKSDRRETLEFHLEMTLTRRFIHWLGEPLFKTVWNITLTGTEHLPASGPVVVSSNHLTNFDIFPVQIAVLPRPIFFMAKTELFYNPALSWLIRQLGAFPIRRGVIDTWALEYAAKVLAAGQVLGVFPEGTRSKGGGLKEGKPGAAQLALKANAPIVPLALTGTEWLFHPWYRRSPVTIALGPPIYPAPADTPATLTERAMRAIAQMLPAASRGVYGDKINA